MATSTTRQWMFWVTLLEAMFAFFHGVFFSVWGDQLTSPPWVLIMDGWHDGRFWGTILFLGGALFLGGLQWESIWPRVIGCAVTGVTYVSIGVYLCVAPFIRENALNGSMGCWLLAGTLTLILAGWMGQERYRETQEDRIRRNDARNEQADGQGLRSGSQNDEGPIASGLG